MYMGYKLLKMVRFLYDPFGMMLGSVAKFVMFHW